MLDLVSEITHLKKDKNATILAHYYQDGEIQELADFTGDSLKLARAATKVQDRRPSSSAASTSWPRRPRCSTPTSACCCPTSRPAAASPRAARPTSWPATRRCCASNGRQFQTVTYINSTAAVKALSDWVVTSGNAEEIIRRVPDGPWRSCSSPTGTWASTSQEVTGPAR